MSLNKLFNKKISKIFTLTFYIISALSFQSCNKNKHLLLNTTAGVEMVNLTDFQLENVYFEENLCKESESIFCITKENAEKYVKNMIILRKALNEREEKFKLIKEVAQGDEN